MKELFKALADFQQECPIILKEAKGYNYKYSDLPSIVETINPLLKKHKLGYYQPLRYTEGIRKLATIVFHTETGNSIESEIDIPVVEFKGMNDYQSLGSGITYLRRYTLSSALGIVTDEDNDAAGEQVKGMSIVDSGRKKITKNEYEKATSAIRQQQELPWLTQKMFDSSVRRIQEANPNVHLTEDGNDLEMTTQEFVDKLSASFRMKKDFKEALMHEVNFTNTLNKVEDPQQQTIL